MLMIRLSRAGRKKNAYFHLVVAEKSKAVQKKYVEKLGQYNPHANKGEGEFTFSKDRVLHFIKNGAQLSQTVARMLSKQGLKEAGGFIKTRPSKPKKEVKAKEGDKEATDNKNTEPSTEETTEKTSEVTETQEAPENKPEESVETTTEEEKPSAGTEKSE